MYKGNCIKRLLALVLSLAMVMGFNVTASAKEVSDDTWCSTPEEISKFLESTNTLQTVVVSEMDMIDNSVKNGVDKEVYREMLVNLKNKQSTKLTMLGFDDSKASVVKMYDETADPVEFIRANALATASLTVKYGLAGSDINKRTTRIAYETIWSSSPHFMMTDQVVIGWVMADKDSFTVNSKVDSYDTFVSYHYILNDKNWRTDTPNTNCDINYLATNFGMGSSPDTTDYAKKTSGRIELSTQSGSYNMETIQICIAYGHMTVAISPDFSISIDKNPISIGIKFSTGISTEAKLIHTFRWNDYSSVITN